MGLHEMFSKAADWEKAIGRLMLASARIEHRVLIAVATSGDPAAMTALSDRTTHAQRINALARIARGLPKEKRQMAKRILSELRTLNTGRNHVAHNPLMYAIDDRGPGKEFGAILQVRDPRKRISLGQIEALAEKSGEIARTFTFLWLLVTSSPWEFETLDEPPGPTGEE